MRLPAILKKARPDLTGSSVILDHSAYARYQFVRNGSIQEAAIRSLKLMMVVPFRSRALGGDKQVEPYFSKCVANPAKYLEDTVMNSIVYIVGLVVVVGAILSFIGLR